MKHVMMTITLFSLFTFLVSGCGSGEKPQNNDTGETRNSKPTSSSGNNGSGGSSGGIIAGSVEPSLNIKSSGDTTSLTFELMNQTERIVTYHFNTSQRFDFVIKTSNGKTVKQYSADKMFSQVTGTMTLKQAERIEFEAEVSGLEPGDYKITFWLTANEEQPKLTKSFTVE